MRKAQSCLHFAVGSPDQKKKDPQTRPTAIFVSRSHHEEEGDTREPRTTTTFRQPLHILAHSESTPGKLKDYLRRHPQLAQRARSLHRISELGPTLDDPAPARKGQTQRQKPRRILNVLQSEVAHATGLQVDYLVSAEATTCHVIGVQSSSSSSVSPYHHHNNTKLTSLAHLDECHLPSLDAIVQQHLQYHHHSQHHKDNSITQGDSVDGDDNDDNDNDFGYFLDAVEEEEQEGADFLDTTLPPWKAVPLVSTSPTCPQSFPAIIPSSLVMKQHDETTTTTTRSSTNNNNNKNNNAKKLQLKLHLVGGCQLVSSYQLSLDLLEAWAHLADRYSTQIEMELVTAAISSLNVGMDTETMSRGSDAPGSTSSTTLLSRGMAIDCHTGRVFGIQSIAPSLQGPAIEVRQARLWARAMMGPTKSTMSEKEEDPNKNNRLAVIHTPYTSEICIAPFDYQPHPQLDLLLQKPNDVLKQITSTSPDLEDEHFCTGVRRTLSWLQLVPSQEVFGGGMDYCGDDDETQSQKHDDHHDNSGVRVALPPSNLLRPLRYVRSAMDIHEWLPSDSNTLRALQKSQSALLSLSKSHY